MHKCPACGHLSEPAVHLNTAGDLPPVDCPLLISVNGELIKARRTGFIEGKDRVMEYELPDGSKISGRFDWTYP